MSRANFRKMRTEHIIYAKLFFNLKKISSFRTQRKGFFMRRHLRAGLFTAAIISLLISALLFHDFISNKAPHNAEIRPSERGAVAIVVLTGGRGRIDEGLRLLTLDVGQVLILSGVNSRASLKSIFPAGLA